MTGAFHYLLHIATFGSVLHGIRSVPIASFLTDRRDFRQNSPPKGNEQTARNETRWHHLRPAGAGFLRKYFASGRRGRDKSGKAKNNERKLNYENSENYIYDSPVRAGVL